MIKCNKGKMEFEGSASTLRAEMTCLVNTFANDKDLSEGDTEKERQEWFQKNIVDVAFLPKETLREKAARALAESLLASLFAKDDDDDEEDDE